MDYKWIGSILIIGGCGGYGYLLCSRHTSEITALKDLVRILEFMAWELQFQMTPLPEICEKASHEGKGAVGEAFFFLAEALKSRTQPDVSVCMDFALKKTSGLPVQAHRQLTLLGSTLGRFDLDGQLQGMESVRTGCLQALSKLEENKTQRLRMYQTLGLCTGAAMAILLI